jgi:hypothetical protein
MDTLVMIAPVGLSLRVSRPATRHRTLIALVARHPAERDDTRAGLLKIAALYTMNIEADPATPLAFARASNLP